MQGLTQVRQALQRLAQGYELTGIGRTTGDTAQESLNIGNTLEGLAQVLATCRVRHQLCHRLLTSRDGLQLAQGLFKPAAQQAGSHRRDSLVEHLQQAALPLALPHGTDELKVAAGDGIEHQVL